MTHGHIPEAVVHSWLEPACSFAPLRRLSGELEPDFNDAGKSKWTGCLNGSSSREVRIRVPFFGVVYFSRGTLPQKMVTPCP